MRIAISGTANQGKSTLTKDFIENWPNYSTVQETYRDIIVNKKLPHSKNATKETQWLILNHMIAEMQKYGKDSKVIYDRCPLDNLVYSMWCMEKGTSDIDKEFIDKCIPLVRESMKMLDIIYFIPLTKAAPQIEIKNDGVREIDPIYIKEIDAIFKALVMQYTHNMGRNPFFPADDCPGIIEIFGTREERLALIRMYINSAGDLIGGNPDDPTNLFNPENLTEIENLLKSQKYDAEQEKAYLHEIKKIKEFAKSQKR